MSLLNKADPFRPADWRFAAAHHLVDNCSGRVYADEWVHKLAAYMDDVRGLARRGLAGPAADRVLKWHGPVHLAWQLRRRPAVPNPLTGRAGTGGFGGLAVVTVKLECAALARRSPVQTAAALGGLLSAEAVDAYHRLFFDVSSRLSCPAFVCGTVLGPLHVGKPEEVLPALARATAYVVGSARAADTVLYGFDLKGVRRAARKGGSASALLTDVTSALGVKAALASRCSAPTFRSVRTNIEVYLKSVEVARLEGMSAATEGEDKYREATRRVLDEFKTTYRRDPLEATPPPPALAAWGPPPESGFAIPAE